MRRKIILAAAAAAALPMIGLAAAPASAATGKVVVFSLEVGPLDIYENPSGCYKLPAGAHVLDNMTDAPVRVYATPACIGPALTIRPDYGSHVPPVAGSFSA
jgi:hypothetical protein